MILQISNKQYNQYLTIPRAAISTDPSLQLPTDAVRSRNGDPEPRPPAARHPQVRPRHGVLELGARGRPHPHAHPGLGRPAALSGLPQRLDPGAAQRHGHGTGHLRSQHAAAPEQLLQAEEAAGSEEEAAEQGEDGRG